MKELILIGLSRSGKLTLAIEELILLGLSCSGEAGFVTGAEGTSAGHVAGTCMTVRVLKQMLGKLLRRNKRSLHGSLSQNGRDSCGISRCYCLTAMNNASTSWPSSSYLFRV